MRSEKYRWVRFPVVVNNEGVTDPCCRIAYSSQQIKWVGESAADAREIAYQQYPINGSTVLLDVRLTQDRNTRESVCAALTATGVTTGFVAVYFCYGKMCGLVGASLGLALTMSIMWERNQCCKIPKEIAFTGFIRVDHISQTSVPVEPIASIKQKLSAIKNSRMLLFFPVESLRDPESDKVGEMFYTFKEFLTEGAEQILPVNGERAKCGVAVATLPEVVSILEYYVSQK